MNTTENRIRDLAYQIWESEGRPHGQAGRHWEMASKLADEGLVSEGSLQMTASVPKSRKASQGAKGSSQQQAETETPAKPVRKSRSKSTTPQMG
jgi:hypothetical protein